ncbi:hypothetical protein [Embleya sp. NBC_00896]|uniref:hypothetical protein n=1 Tax=Embleya sp. NBC_00896 TaxID=2975961 RepID=UPI00386BC599
MSLISAPAFANIRDDGDEPGAEMGIGATLALFVGVPVLAFVIIAGLVMLPGIRKKH